MTYYSVLEVTPTSDLWVQPYLETANKRVAYYGGKFLARTTSHQIIEGDREAPGLRIIIEWPSEQAALDFANDKDYAPHLKARLEGSISHHALIKGKDELV